LSESLTAFEVVSRSGNAVLPPRILSDAFLLQGVLRGRLGAAPESVHIFYYQGLETDPTNSNAWIRWGENGYLIDHDYNKMMKSLRMALNLEPNSIANLSDILSFLSSLRLSDAIQTVCSIYTFNQNPEIQRYCLPTGTP